METNNIMIKYFGAQNAQAILITVIIIQLFVIIFSLNAIVKETRFSIEKVDNDISALTQSMTKFGFDL